MPLLWGSQRQTRWEAPCLALLLLGRTVYRTPPLAEQVGEAARPTLGLPLPCSSPSQRDPGLPARSPPPPPPAPSPSPAAARSALPQLADRFPVALRASVRMGADQPSVARGRAELRSSPWLGSWLLSTISNSSPDSRSASGPGCGPGSCSGSDSCPARRHSPRAAMLAGHVTRGWPGWRPRAAPCGRFPPSLFLLAWARSPGISFGESTTPQKRR